MARCGAARVTTAKTMGSPGRPTSFMRLSIMSRLICSVKRRRNTKSQPRLKPKAGFNFRKCLYFSKSNLGEKFCLVASAGKFSDQGEKGQVHGDHDRADRYAEKRDQNRLDER